MSPNTNRRLLTVGHLPGTPAQHHTEIILTSRECERYRKSAAVGSKGEDAWMEEDVPI